MNNELVTHHDGTCGARKFGIKGLILIHFPNHLARPFINRHQEVVDVVGAVKIDKISHNDR